MKNITAKKIVELLHLEDYTYYGETPKAWDGAEQSRIYFGRDYVTIKDGQLGNHRAGSVRAITIGDRVVSEITAIIEKYEADIAEAEIQPEIVEESGETPVAAPAEKEEEEIDLSQDAVAAVALAPVLEGTPQQVQQAENYRRRRYIGLKKYTGNQREEWRGRAAQNIATQGWTQEQCDEACAKMDAHFDAIVDRLVKQYFAETSAAKWVAGAKSHVGLQWCAEVARVSQLIAAGK